MDKGRLEAFSDGVLAIIITIMVLELKPPQGTSWSALQPLIPTLASYILSFIYVGIYWNNHHHMLQAAKHVNGAVLWANLHLLLWLSLVPIATTWLGTTGIACVPAAIYGFLLFMAGVAYFILAQLIAANGKGSELAQALGKDFKGKLSVVFYAIAIAIAFLQPVVSCVIYVLVAVMWLVPDQRFEHLYAARSSASDG
ncbi:MAG TPA: TMEM175 family protein [Fimbriimonadaceae bacterium]|jgi:uncharacterized membrane protein